MVGIREKCENNYAPAPADLLRKSMRGDTADT